MLLDPSLHDMWQGEACSSSVSGMYLTFLLVLAGWLWEYLPWVSYLITVLITALIVSSLVSPPAAGCCVFSVPGNLLHAPATSSSSRMAESGSSGAKIHTGTNCRYCAAQYSISNYSRIGSRFWATDDSEYILAKLWPGGARPSGCPLFCSRQPLLALSHRHVVTTLGLHQHSACRAAGAVCILSINSWWILGTFLARTRKFGTWYLWQSRLISINVILGFEV